MGYLKFSILFLFNLIKHNPTKVIYIIIAIVSFYFAGTIPDARFEEKIDGSIIVNNQYLYIKEYVSDNTIKYEIIQSDKPLVIKDSKYIHYDYSGFNIALWVTFGISLGLMILCTIVGWAGDEDASWNIKGSWRESFICLIYCELENDKYHYMALDRLIIIQDRRLSSCQVEQLISGFKDLRLCPKYKTKTQKREDNLSKLGI